jgi:hypothetical protein
MSLCPYFIKLLLPEYLKPFIFIIYPQLYLYLSAYRIISLSVSVYLSPGIPKPDTLPFHARVEQSELKTCPRVLTEYTFI